jgi:predicted enzyme related to lactoylglutathione lyase
MQHGILAMTMCLGLASGPLEATTHEGPKPDVGSGRIVWFDLTTTNLAVARDFYGKLFDWQFAPVKGTDLAVEIVSRGTAIGTLRIAEGKINPYNGVIYVQVTDVLASSKQVKDLGGTVVPGFPFNLPDGRGAISLFLDPAGHPVGLYSQTPLGKAPSQPK